MCMTSTASVWLPSSVEYPRWRAITGSDEKLSYLSEYCRRCKYKRGLCVKLYTYGLENDYWQQQLLLLNLTTSGLQQSRLMSCIANCRLQHYLLLINCLIIMRLNFTVAFCFYTVLLSATDCDIQYSLLIHYYFRFLFAMLKMRFY